ncbi:hypothetical protein DFQ27_003433 [Actinomortierella ambigua]|uniref:PX domain-containing protein n=1 Tax=Actinomortierella ambigua TaxID=1343610 RepID=A0A9P6Q5Y1_9FUNG|nr:hypothetical protein DFQ27_003433 [Actinomortierella ambigua]
MTETIQAIYVRDYETRDKPKPHTVYRVEVHAAVRTWSVWKRYSEFDTLHDRFVELFPNNPPPEPLPKKHWWQVTMDSPELLEERRAGLEIYLRGILSHRDDRWRKTSEWNEFLAIPVSRSSIDLLGGSSAVSRQIHGGGGGDHNHNNASHASSFTGGLTSLASAHHFTSESWLEEFRTSQGMVREIRSLLNRRETHLNRSEISASHNCTIQAKKLLTSLGLRIPALENGLLAFAPGSGGIVSGFGGHGSIMSDGELRRRQDMLAELKDEREVLTKLVIANRQNDGVGYYQGGGASPASSGDRNALLTSSGRTSAMGGGGNSNGVGGFGDDHHSMHGVSAAGASTTSLYSTSGSTITGGFASNSGSLSGRPSASRRVFGRIQNMVNETAQTRGLDNEGLLMLQKEQMQRQDDHIEQFSAILQRQKHIGLAIGQELDNQIQLLDDLDRDVDRTTLKLGIVSKKVTKIT